MHTLAAARRLLHHATPRRTVGSAVRTAAMPDGHPPGQPPPASSSLAFVSAADLRARLVGGDAAPKPLILDVRDADERAASITGALHVPAHRLRGDGPAADAELDAVLA